MGYLLRRVLLLAAPVLWRKFRQRRQKKQAGSAGTSETDGDHHG